MILWRTVSVCAMITLILTVRAIATRPWLLNGVDANHWYYVMRSMVHPEIRSNLLAPLAEAFPWVLTGSVLYYYAAAALKRWAGGLHAGWRHSLALLSVGTLAFAGWVLPTALGLAFLIAQAAFVALFAELQWMGWRRAVAA